MLARRDDDAERRARIDIDMRVNAALTDEREIPQPLQQRRADRGALAYQHQHVGVTQSFAQNLGVLYVVVPDRDFIACELVEAIEAAQGVEVVVENGDVHDRIWGAGWPLDQNYLNPRVELT